MCLTLTCDIQNQYIIMRQSAVGNAYIYKIVIIIIIVNLYSATQQKLLRGAPYLKTPKQYIYIGIIVYIYICTLPIYIHIIYKHICVKIVINNVKTKATFQDNSWTYSCSFCLCLVHLFCAAGEYRPVCGTCHTFQCAYVFMHLTLMITSR